MTRLAFGTTILLTLIACGGGGGSGASNPRAPTAPPAPPPPAQPSGSGSLTLTVVDALGDPFPFVDVQVVSQNPPLVGRTGATGELRFTGVRSGTVNVFAYTGDDEYGHSGGTASSTLEAGQHLAMTLVARPTGSPAIGTTRPIVAPEDVSPDRRSLTFRLTLTEVVFDDSWDTLSVRLEPCAPDSGNDQPSFRADCVAGPAGFDTAYEVIEPAHFVPAVFDEAGTTPLPYSAVLLVDQGRRTETNDPWDRRLFGLKYFVHKLAGNSASLAAFAADDLAGEDSKLADQPVTVVAESVDSTSYAVIDELASLEGGASPLTAALAVTLDEIAASPLPSSPQRKIVVLTDGHDDTCGSVDQCRVARETVAEKSAAYDAELVLVVLPGGAESDRRNVAELVAASGGRAFWLESAAQVPAVLGNLPEALGTPGKTAELTFRIEAPVSGAFAPGRIVHATVTVEICPWDCYITSFPIAVQIP